MNMTALPEGAASRGRGALSRLAAMATSFGRGIPLSTRLIFAMCALVALTAAAVATLASWNLEAAVRPVRLEQIARNAERLARDVEQYVQGARADVLALTASETIRALARGAADTPASDLPSPEPQARARGAARLLTQLEVKPAYYQFRVIGVADGGRELVRAERSATDGTPRLVPDDQLQRKGDTGYFRAAIALRAGDIYVSPIELNREFGEVENPPVPVVRVATPVMTPQGTPFGIIVVNVDMRPAFARLRQYAPLGGEVRLVNADGEYLLHPDPARSFRFEYNASSRVQDEFPELAALLASPQGGTAMVMDRSGAAIAAAVEPGRIAGATKFFVITTLPRSELLAPVGPLRTATLMAGLLTAGVAVILAIVLARSVTRPIEQMTKALEGFSGRDNLAVPVAEAGPVGDLARSLARLADDVRERDDRLRDAIDRHRRNEGLLRRYAEQERLFTAVVQSSADAVITMSLGGTITAWNHAAERMFGYAADEAIGSSLDIIVPPDRRDEIRDMLERISRGEHVEHHDTVRRAKDARLVEVSSSISPIRSQSGEIIGAAKILRDVTERRMAEANFRLAVEASPSGVLMIDRDGAIVLANAEIQRMFGYDRGDLIGRPVETLVPERFRTGHDALRDTFFSSPSVRAMGAGRDLYGLRRDGTEFPVEIGLNPIETADGMLVLATVIDITERKFAEMKFKLAVEAAPSGVLMVDRHGLITLANAEIDRLFGYARNELIGRPIEDLMPERFRASHDAMRAAFVISPAVRRVGIGREFYALRKDGSEFPVEIGLNPIESPDGLHVMAVVIDITSRKREATAIARYTEELRRSNTELEQFAYVASHDLQEPLRMVATFTQLLADRYRGKLDDKADQYIQHAVDGAKRMQGLVRDLLHFSRVTSTERSLHLVDSAGVVRTALGNLAALIADCEAEVVTGTLPVVVSDETELGQVFQNLTANALKFRSERPLRVTIDARRDDGEWVFWVQDNGIGIDVKHHDRIFHMFQRLHQRGKYEGNGIGLAIVKKIVERHGGKIWIESILGEGATFYFTIPDKQAGIA